MYTDNELYKSYISDNVESAVMMRYNKYNFFFSFFCMSAEKDIDISYRERFPNLLREPFSFVLSVPDLLPDMRQKVLCSFCNGFRILCPETHI